MAPTDPKTPPPAPVSELQLIDTLVTSLDDALATIDRAEAGARTPGEQLATLAVGIVRGLAPLLRAERDRMIAEAAR